MCAISLLFLIHNNIICDFPRSIKLESVRLWRVLRAIAFREKVDLSAAEGHFEALNARLYRVKLHIRRKLRRRERKR